MFRITYNDTYTDFETPEEVTNYLNEFLNEQSLKIDDRTFTIMPEIYSYEYLKWATYFTEPTHLIQSGSNNFYFGLEKLE